MGRMDLTITKARLLLLVLFAMAGCTHSRTASFFPPKASQDYVAHYRTMGEEPLWNLGNRRHGQTTYRFMAPNCFEPPELARIDVLPDGTKRLIVKTTTGAGGSSNRTGQLDLCATNSISDEDFSFITNHLAKTGFFAVPHDIDNHEVLDSSPHIIEVLRGGRYHVVQWTSPSGPFADAFTRIDDIAFPGRFRSRRGSTIIKIAPTGDADEAHELRFGSPIILVHHDGRVCTWPRREEEHSLLSTRLYGDYRSRNISDSAQEWTFTFSETVGRQQREHKITIPVAYRKTADRRHDLSSRGTYSVRPTAPQARTERGVTIPVTIHLMDSDWVTQTHKTAIEAKD